MKMTETQDLSADILREIERFGSLFPNRFESLLQTPVNSLGRLAGLDANRKTQILNGFRFSVDQLQSAAEVDPESLEDESRLLRQVVRQMRLVISEDVYNLIEKDDIVEIHNSELVQVYRGLSFMNLSNYTLLDLLTYEFHELCDRSMVVNQYLFDAVNEVRNRNTLNGLSLSHVPSHLMRERFADPQGVFEIKFRHCFPVYRWPKEYFGTLMILKATPYHDFESLKGISFV